MANNYLYAESPLYGIGFVVFSISGTNLTVVGQNQNLLSDTGGTGFYHKMIISGSQVYVANGSSGLQTVNVSSPFNPSLSSTFTELSYGNYGSVGVTGNILCASDGNNLKIFDVSQPGELSEPVGHVDGIGAEKIVAANGIACVGANNGIRLYSLATSSVPQLEYTISIDSCIIK